jgi:hypothetical protein
MKPFNAKPASFRNVAQARSALNQSQNLAPEQQTHLRRKVHMKFPGIGKAHAMARALKGV